MADQFGFFHWQGIRGLTGATFTQTHGITPAVCQMTVVPQGGNFPRAGVLTITFGATQFSFPNCRVDRLESVRDSVGNELWQLTILDRRWRWRESGTISGCYNTRRDNGGSVVPGSEKNARELCQLCLDAMGESGADVRQVPTNVFPEIDWDAELPAAMLADLCDQLGLRVVMRLNGGQVQIVKAGQGAMLPTRADTERSFVIDPAETPDELAILVPIWYQGDFRLFPLGLESDGRILPINQLSYTPRVNGRRTWEQCDLDKMTAVDPRFRQLALQSVYRWFGIVTPFELPGVDGAIDSVNRILPLQSHQIETTTVEGRREPRPCWLYGAYYLGNDIRTSTTVNTNLVNQPQGLYQGPWSLDTKRGIVKTSHAVYRLVQNQFGFAIQPPDLRLRTSCQLRDEENGQFERYARVKRFPGNPGPKRFRRSVRRDDIIREIYRRWTPPANIVDNKQQVDREADVLLGGLMAEYDTESAQSKTYAGFEAIPLDGAIQQVTWIIDSDGYARTRASRNREELIVTPSFKERRLYEKITDALAKRDTPRAQAERQRRGRA